MFCKRLCGFRQLFLYPSSGFTLLEISVTLLIVGVLVAGVTPGLRSALGDFYLESSARELAEHIQELEQTSLSEESADYYIQFYLSPTDIYLVKKAANSLPLVVASVGLPPTVSLQNTSFNKHKLFISARGTPYPKGGTITLKDEVSGRLKYVIVASITGRVRISDRPPESWETS